MLARPTMYLLIKEKQNYDEGNWRIAANNVGPTTPYPNVQEFLDSSNIRKNLLESRVDDRRRV